MDLVHPLRRVSADVAVFSKIKSLYSLFKELRLNLIQTPPNAGELAEVYVGQLIRVRLEI